MTNYKNNLINKPYSLFLITGFGLMISSLFMLGKSAEIHLHDTYFIIPVNIFIWVLAGFFFIVWAIYKASNNYLWTPKLTWIHVSITILTLIFISIFGSSQNYILFPPKVELLSYQNLLKNNKTNLLLAYSALIVFTLGQAAFLVNLAVGLIRRNR